MRRRRAGTTRPPSRRSRTARSSSRTRARWRSYITTGSSTPRRSGSSTRTSSSRSSCPSTGKRGAAVGHTLRTKLAPYALIFPGGLWLLLFFVVPMAAMFSLSLTQGDVISGFEQTFHWQTYANAITNYQVQIERSIYYGLITTVLQILLGFPVAYWIAFRGGRRKSIYLFLLLLPFFVSFVLRTISWQFFLTDEGLLLTWLRALHLVSPSFHITGTAFAVIGG